jgi:hypothetical protein
MSECDHAAKPFDTYYLRDSWIQGDYCPYCRITQLQTELSECKLVIADRDSSLCEAQRTEDQTETHYKEMVRERDKLREVQAVVCCACGQLNQHQPELEKKK